MLVGTKNVELGLPHLDGIPILSARLRLNLKQLCEAMVTLLLHMHLVVLVVRSGRSFRRLWHGNGLSCVPSVAPGSTGCVCMGAKSCRFDPIRWRKVGCQHTCPPSSSFVHPGALMGCRRLLLPTHVLAQYQNMWIVWAVMRRFFAYVTGHLCSCCMCVTLASWTGCPLGPLVGMN